MRVTKLFIHLGSMAKRLEAKIGRLPVQTPLDARPSLRTQPYYEASSDLWLKIVKTQ